MLERRVVSILFADLVESTPLAGRVDPEELRELLSRYRDAVSAVVDRFGGTMEKFIGDAVLALFGFPSAHDDDPQRALRAAFQIRDAVGSLGPGLQVRIGVCTGEVIADPAARDRGEFIVTGEPVHRAQRLQSAAAPGEILVDDRTRRDTRSDARSGGRGGKRQFGFGCREWILCSVLLATVPGRHQGTTRNLT